LIASARADLTIVQTVEGAGAMTEMTIKIKGDKARIEPTPQVSTIIDSRTGEMLNVMHEQKKYLRVPADAAKAFADLAAAADTKKEAAEKPKLNPTGKKETINGYEAEEYVWATPTFTANYWLSTKYPNSAAIMKQLQTMSASGLGATNQMMPDYRDFPGLPLRSVINMNGTQITSTLKSVSADPLSDAEFIPPAGFEEMKMPGAGSKPAAKADAAPKSAPSPKR
jgi:hypothetical protein